MINRPLEGGVWRARNDSDSEHGRWVRQVINQLWGTREGNILSIKLPSYAMDAE